MNASDVLKYGHLTVLGTAEGLAADAWDKPGVCGVWSAKDVVAHLAWYQLVLNDVLAHQIEGSAMPHLDTFMSGPQANDAQVDRRRTATPAQAIAELKANHERTMALAARIAPETLRRPGTLPWYGAEYALDDLIVYQYYGHMREHSAEIAVLIDRLKRG